MSHRPDLHDVLRSQRRRANPGNDATVVQVSKEALLGYEKVANSRNRLSVASSSSAGQRSTDSSDGANHRSAGQRRRSSIPRPILGHSSTRLDQIASSRPLPSTIAARKPVPASSGPAKQDPSNMGYQSNWVLKQSTVATSTPSATWKTLTSSTASSGPISIVKERSSTVPNPRDSEKRRPTRPAIVPPDDYTQQSSMEFPPRLIPELQALAASTVRAASVSRASSAQPPSIGSISSPSTLFTESPGTWSSRNTTPTSISSYSPGVVTPLKISASGRRSNTVPIPAAHTKSLPRLPALPETLKAAGSRPSQSDEPTSSTRRKKKKLLDSPAPTPPPRASSVKHKKTESDSAVELSDAHKFSSHQYVNSRHENNSASGQKLPSKPGVAGNQHFPETERYTSSETHEVPLFLAPPRPSRDNVEYFEPRLPAVVDTSLTAERSGHDIQSAGLLPARQLSIPTRPAEPAPAALRTTSQPPDTGSVTRNLTHAIRSAPVSRIQTPFTDSERPDTAATRPSSSGRESPSTRAGFFSRLAMLTRSSKTPDSVSPKKLQRKGPAAGSGYEGYGKLSRKSRKSSLESSQSGSSSDVSEAAYGQNRTPVHSRKPSSSSRRDRSSQSDLDDFAAQRLRPKVMRGGSGKFESDEEEIGVAIPIPLTERLGLQPSLLRESHYTVPASPRSFVTSASSSMSIPAPTIATSWQSTPRHSAPRRHHDIFGPGSLRSATTSQSSIGSSIPAYARPSTPLHKVEAKISPKPEKKPRRLRWNIFARSTTPGKGESCREVKPSSPPKMAVQLTAGPLPRSLPYYAIIDSESDQNIPDGLGTFINEAVASSPHMQDQPFRGHSEIQNPTYPVPSATYRTYDSSVTSFDSLAPPPSFMTASQSRIEEPPAPQKKRRLAAVGRIPRVVSRKGRFSIGSNSGKSLAESNVPSVAMTARPPPKVFDERNYEGRREFLHLPSQHGSDVSVSSASTSLYSTPAPVYMPLQAQRNMARHYTGEEEVWNEYDDFLDHVLAPPLHRYVPPPHSQLYQAAALPTIPVILAPNTSRLKPTERPELQRLGPNSMRDAEDMSADAKSQFELELRRSRILSALRSSMDPTSPFTIADYLSENGDWLRYSAKLSDRQSTSSPDHPPVPVVVASENHAQTTNNVDNTQQHNAALIDAVARTRNPIAQSELHLSSLMISRWLSFGRVLFSPAHEEVNNSPGRHILVFDGLGNADWSIFCSVTYAAQNTFVHDLKEKDGQRSFEPDHAPLNYRRTEVRSLCDQFPFPPSFFSAIVLRFPPAIADAKMRNMIGECMRVLVPGGYLELMLLDLDIVNMGTITRRAMRDLKIRITTQDRALSLKPLSDNIQSHLGQQGFPSLSRCVVGVPVVGNASASMDSSSSSRSSGDSYGRTKAPPQGGTSPPGFRQHRSSRSHGQNFSLSDLVADHSDNADAKIGKMVSRTARNWWQHCFEASVIPDGDLSRSIFTDKKLIRECKARSSNFKLLIAYTQKPTDNTRRTLSESSMPTLTTSGVRRPKQT